MILIMISCLKHQLILRTGAFQAVGLVGQFVLQPELGSLALGFLVFWWIPVKQVVANWLGALEPEYAWKILYDMRDYFIKNLNVVQLKYAWFKTVNDILIFLKIDKVSSIPALWVYFTLEGYYKRLEVSVAY